MTKTPKNLFEAIQSYASNDGHLSFAQLATKEDSVIVDGNTMLRAVGPGATCKNIGATYGECTVYDPAEEGAIEYGVESGGRILVSVEKSPLVKRGEGVTCWIRKEPGADEIKSGCEAFPIGVS